jgi:hypothetical protein
VLSSPSTAVEVVRVTTFGPTQVLGLAVSAVAAASLAVLVAAWWRRGTDDRWAWWLAVTSSGAELVVRTLAFGPASLGDARLLAVAGRLVTILAAAVAVRTLADDDRGRRIAMGALGALALATVPLAVATGPVLGGAGVTAVTLAVVALAWLAAGRGTTRARVAMAVAGALVLGGLALPPREPPSYDARLDVDGLTLDVTVIPAGREIHVYAWDDAGRPAAIEEVVVRVPATGVRLELFAVSADHHLSYVLEIPDQRPVALVLDARHDGAPVTARWTLEDR